MHVDTYFHVPDCILISLTPATDLFLDIVHVNSGEQIRVFLTTITAPACSLSFTGSVKISNFQAFEKELIDYATY